MILDQFGREVKITKRPETREIAVTTVRDRWSTYPSQGMTPQTLATIFKEADTGDVYHQAELFEEMEEKDAHLFSVLQTRKNAVLGLDYEVQPYSDSEEDKKIQDFVADCIFGLTNLEDALLDLLDAVGKGYSLAEIIWQVEGQRVVIGDLRWIHPKKAAFYEFEADMWAKSYEVPGIFTEAEPVKGEIMPPFKLVYHRYKARSGYDTRAGVLRVCAWVYLFKNYALKDWITFAEIFGMPLRLGKYDTSATSEDREALITAIKSLGTDAAGIISKSTEIEFVQSVAGITGGNIIFEKLVEFCDKQMSKAVLGQTASTEGTPGKLGNEDAQDGVRHDLIKADAEALAKTVRFQIIRPLVGYNFGWDKPLPWFKMLYEPPEDMKMLSDVYKNLHEINYPLTVKHVSERFKVPIPEDGDALLEKPNTPPVETHDVETHDVETHGRTSLRKILKNSEGTRFTPEQRGIEDLSDASLKESEKAFRGILEPVKAMIRESESFDELRKNILSAYKDMDTADLEDLLQRAIFTADMWGRYTA